MSKPAWMRHIPNILTFFRIALVFVFIMCMVSKWYLASIIIFLVAALTDILDGNLARKNNWISNLGKLLDPIADKFMTISALFCLWYAKMKTIYLILCIAVLIKEVLLMYGALKQLIQKVVVQADVYGKMATLFLFSGIVLSLVSLLVPVLEWAGLVLLIMGTGIAFVALYHYAKFYLGNRQKDAKDPDA